ncbi:unnamed protein product [Acanthosepion pharaonis]|uniref:Protein tyrosine phosphatase n=1 Tax=Acanthosepion pharaonis TaxID=158019 RepID=A0A812BM26_ACAPH|nr:unnamed protein product [Sepia pharaonis]
MIWQEKCNTIVMLTEIMENGKLKCCVYWPKLNEIENHGKFQIQCVQEKHSMVYIYRILAIKKYSVKEKRFVHHFQCTIWPDHGILEEPASFIEFRNKVRFSPSSKPPFVVHCSAGDGRTGTYIALDILFLEQLWKKPTIDIVSCVNQLFVSKGHSWYKTKVKIFVTSIPEEFKKLQTSKANGEKSILKKQYEEFIFPLNQSHPTESYQELIHTNVEINNVFEASCKNFHEPIFVDGFFMKNEFMLTLQPSKKNADMFWKLIYEKRYSIIVMLDDTPKFASVYWPQKINCTEVYGSIKVELKNTTESKTFFQRYFQVSSTKQVII